MFGGVDRIPACDGRTDGRTDILRQHSPHYAYASHSKNCFSSNVAQIKMYWKTNQKYWNWEDRDYWNGSIIKKVLRYWDNIIPYTKHNTNRNSNIKL